MRILYGLLVAVVVGCSSTEGEPVAERPAEPAPNEPLVWSASNETTTELGIAKWGFASDKTGATYRGYGAKNEVLATVVQKHDVGQRDRRTFTMTFTGPTASASEKLEVFLRPKANSTTGEQEIVMTVEENTFEEGQLPSRVLARFKADSGNAGSMTQRGAAGLVAQSFGEQLVSSCNESVSRCQSELVEAIVATNDEAAACGLVKFVGEPLIVCGAAAAGAAISGPGAGAACAVAAGADIAVNAVNCFAAWWDADDERDEFYECDEEACQGGE
jgi:hypothetical protein